MRTEVLTGGVNVIVSVKYCRICGFKRTAACCIACEFDGQNTNAHHRKRLLERSPLLCAWRKWNTRLGTKC